MKLKTLFNSINEATIADYMFEKGIQDPFNFKKGNADINWHEEAFTDAIKMIEDNKEKPFYCICDCDVDGYTSASIVLSALNTYGIPAKPLLHTGKQHGIDEIVERGLLVENSVLIVPDASIDNYLYDTLDAMNILSIILDHHEISPFINDYHDEKHLLINNGEIPQSGAIVAMKFAHALIGKLDSYYYELACLGNCADVQDQTYQETRAINLVGYYPEHLFLAEMYNTLNDDNSPFDLEFISWRIAPKLNAVIRGNSPELKMKMFKALCTEQYEFDLPSELVAYHEAQKRKVKSIFQKTEINNDHNVIIAMPQQVEDIAGINGLIAGRIEGANNKPVFCVAEEDGMCYGSCRSPFPIRQMCVDSGLFDKAQGHGAAFGIAFSADNIDKIYSYFDAINMGDAEEVEVLCLAVPREITQRFIKEFGSQDFYGMGIERPLVYVRPFTMNLKKDIEFTNKFKTDIAIKEVNTAGERYDFEMKFISKVKRLAWGLGENIDAKVSMLCQPKVRYEGKRCVHYMAVKELFIEKDEDEFDW